MKKSSLSALVAAGLLVGGLSAGSASAADLGGNCCADLEERIAELEATTARKGNRKVSLTVSGWVGEQVMYWDDERAREHLRDGPRFDACFALQVHGSGDDLSRLVGGLRDPRGSDGIRDSLTINQFSQHNLYALVAGELQLRWPCSSCSPTGSSRATTSASSASACSRRLRITRRSGRRLRLARSGELGDVRLQRLPAPQPGTIWPQLAGRRLLLRRRRRGRRLLRRSARRRSATTRRPSAGSRSRPLGVKTTSGTSRLATRVSTTASSLLAAAYSQWSQDFFAVSRCRFPWPPTAAVSITAGYRHDYFQIGAYVEHVPTGLWLYGAYGHVDPDGTSHGVTTLQRPGRRHLLHQGRSARALASPGSHGALRRVREVQRRQS